MTNEDRRALIARLRAWHAPMPTQVADMLAEDGRQIERLKTNCHREIDRADAAEQRVAELEAEKRRAIQEGHYVLPLEQNAEVARLRAENERLRLGRGPDDPTKCPAGHGNQCCGYADLCRAALEQISVAPIINAADCKFIARQALAPEPTDSVAEPDPITEGLIPGDPGNRYVIAERLAAKPDD